MIHLRSIKEQTAVYTNANQSVLSSNCHI